TGLTDLHGFLADLIDSDCHRSLIVIAEDRRCVFDARRHAALRDALEEDPSVRLSPDAWVQNGVHTFVSRRSNKPSQSLLQRYRRLRHRVLIKLIAPLVVDILLSSGDDRVTGDCERQLRDDHTGERGALNVNALPE